MRWCSRCVLPDSRPLLTIGDDGVCSACKTHDEEDRVDWEARRKEWEALVEEVKAKRRPYDCIVAVSGGKDSWNQTKICLDSSLHTLAVSWKPVLRTPLGYENLEGLKRLGVDHIDFSVNPNVERKMYRKSFLETGSDNTMHAGVFFTVARFAWQFKIPLVVWSENSATTLVGGDNPWRGADLNNEWVRVLGSTLGWEAKDWLGQDGITEQDLEPYKCPTDEQMEASGIRQVFMGYFFKWDGYQHYLKAKELGFKDGTRPITGIYRWADQDDPFVSAHHALKFWKFGFTRTMDNLTQEIRNGRMTRKAALKMIRDIPDDTNYSALGQFLKFIGLDLGDYFRVADRFRNRTIWQQTNGRWEIPGFIVNNFDWHRHPASKKIISRGDNVLPGLFKS